MWAHGLKGSEKQQKQRRIWSYKVLSYLNAMLQVLCGKPELGRGHEICYCHCFPQLLFSEFSCSAMFLDKLISLNNEGFLAEILSESLRVWGWIHAYKALFI